MNWARFFHVSFLVRGPVEGFAERPDAVLAVAFPFNRYARDDVRQFAVVLRVGEHAHFFAQTEREVEAIGEREAARRTAQETRVTPEGPGNARAANARPDVAGEPRR